MWHSGTNVSKGAKQISHHHYSHSNYPSSERKYSLHLAVSLWLITSASQRETPSLVAISVQRWAVLAIRRSGLLWQRWRKQEAIQLPACSFITLMWLRKGLAAPWICCELFCFAHTMVSTSIPLVWLLSFTLYWQRHSISMQKLWNLNLANAWDTNIFKKERKIIAKIQNYTLKKLYDLYVFYFVMKWALCLSSEESPISKSASSSCQWSRSCDQEQFFSNWKTSLSMFPAWNGRLGLPRAQLWRWRCTFVAFMMRLCV